MDEWGRGDGQFSDGAVDEFCKEVSLIVFIVVANFLIDFFDKLVVTV